MGQVSIWMPNRGHICKTCFCKNYTFHFWPSNVSWNANTIHTFMSEGKVSYATISGNWLCFSLNSGNIYSKILLNLIHEFYPVWVMWDMYTVVMTCDLPVWPLESFNVDIKNYWQKCEKCNINAVHYLPFLDQIRSDNESWTYLSLADIIICCLYDVIKGGYICKIAQYPIGEFCLHWWVKWPACTEWP